MRKGRGSLVRTCYKKGVSLCHLSFDRLKMGQKASQWKQRETQICLPGGCRQGERRQMIRKWGTLRNLVWCACVTFLHWS
jgi:hypothetical protein